MNRATICGVLAIFLASVVPFRSAIAQEDLDLQELSRAGRQAYERGVQQLEESAFDEAVQSFTDVIALHPDFAEGYTARAAESNPPPPDPEFDDHPLEVVLREQGKRRSDDNRSDTLSSKPCPKCGRINSVQTRICPSCEHRISG